MKKKVILSTNGLVAGSGTLSTYIAGQSNLIHMRMEAPFAGTNWYFTITFAQVLASSLLEMIKIIEKL